MMKYVSGDILLSNADVIAHGVAPHDHFDHGLALALRERWPALAKDFRHYCHQNNPEAGQVYAWAGPDETRGSVKIVNLMTQEASAHQSGHPGKASAHTVGHALKELAKLAKKEGYTSIALPKLATGVGGMDWAEVEPLIKKHLGDVGVPVFVYTEYHAGQAADEGS